MTTLGVSYPKLVRYYSSVTAIYVVTLFMAALLIKPNLLRLRFPDLFGPTYQITPQEAPLIPLSPTVISGKPVRLVIPSLNMDLQVIDGSYDPSTGQWTLSGDKAQFAVITTPANNVQGNTFIYGHYNPHVFLSLHKIQPDQEAIIYTDNNHIFHYKYKSQVTVSPTDTGVFDYRGAPILTIQTCTGTFYEKRQIFTFDFSSVDSGVNPS